MEILMEKLYTAAEVAQMLAAERAKSVKAITITRKSGVTQRGYPYSGIQVTGPFKPCYLPESVAQALADNHEMLVTALETPIPTAETVETVETEPLTSSSDAEAMAPRIATKA